MATLSACNWVDSTGLQRSSTSNPLDDGGTLVLVEELPTTTQLIGTGQQLRGWDWRADGAGNRDACIAEPGFDIDTAQATLADACADANECQIEINETFNGSTAEFTVRLPALRYSMAAQYLLVASDDSGQETLRRQTLCGIAVNDPPVAVDDEYLIRLDEGIFVAAESTNSIIANDFDDNDARNQGLQVNPVAVQAPQFAEAFELGTDGSFFYLPREDAPFSNDGAINDSFVYSISDGNSSAQATVTLRVVAANSAPQRIAEIPDITLLLNESPFDDFDVASFFSDPDGDTLTFSTTPSSLPSSGTMNLLSDGTLQLAPTINDTGTWQVTVIASDGLLQIEETFLIRVQTGETENTAPEADDIPNMRVSDNFEFGINDYFFDADGDALVYEATGIPPDVFLTSDGIFFGESTDDNEGRWLITVTASDGRGGVVSDAFRLQIN